MKSPQLQVLRSRQDIESLIKYLEPFDYIAYDSETNGLHQGAEVIGISVCAEDDKAYYVIISEWYTTTSQLVYLGNKDLVTTLIQSLVGKSLVMHNGTFDAMMAERYFGVSLIESLHTDTMILAHLLDENRKVGLKDLGKVLFGEDATEEQTKMKASVLANGGKLTKKDYEMYKANGDLLGLYGAKDALLTYRLFEHLVIDLYDQGLDKFFYEEESMPLLKGPTYELNTTGLKVDLQTLTTLKKTLEVECLEAKDFIYKEIHSRIKDKYPATNKKNVFNIGSNQQLSWLLFGDYELEFGALTKAGKNICKSLGIKIPYTKTAKRDFIHTITTYKDHEYSKGKKIKAAWAYIQVDKKTLIKLALKYQWIEKLLEYQRKTKILTTYVKGIESRIQYGVIRPSFLQHGTTSGRYSSRNPNFQNLPRDDKRIKGIIVSRPGKVFVGADYSQLEPRVFAYFSNDERLLKAFTGEDDFYSTIGMAVYDKQDCTPRKEGSPDAFGIKYKKLRDLSKVIALASTYGATAHQLAPTTGKSIEDTQTDIDAYFERFPGVQQMMLNAHKTVKEKGQVLNLFGRPRRIPEAMRIAKIYGNRPHSELPYEIRNLLNLAVNHTIQSTGASIVNRAAIKFFNDCKELAINCKIVVQVHDSLVIECSESDAESVSLLLQNAMETAVQLPGINLEAIPKIGKTLAEV